MKPKLLWILISVLAVAGAGFVLYRKWVVPDFKILSVDKVLFNVTFRFIGKTYTINRSEPEMGIKSGRFTLETVKSNAVSPQLKLRIKRGDSIVRDENVYFL